MTPQPIEVQYKELGLFPIIGYTVAENTGTAPIVAHMIEGTASAVPIPVSINSNIPAHFCALGNIENPRGISGPTCIKFPILVRIWTYIVGFVHVVGVIEGVRQPQPITFETLQILEGKDVTALTFNYATSEDGGSPAYITATIQQIKIAPYVIFTLLTHLFKIGYLRSQPKLLLTKVSSLCAKTYTKFLDRMVIPLRAAVFSHLIRKGFLHIFTAYKQLNCTAYGKIHALNKELLLQAKLSTKTGLQYLQQQAKLLCHLNLPTLACIASLKVVTVKQKITQYGVSLFHVAPITINYFCITKIQVGRAILDKVIAYLETNVFWLLSNAKKHIVTHLANSVHKQSKILSSLGVFTIQRVKLSVIPGVQALYNKTISILVLVAKLSRRVLSTLIQKQKVLRRFFIHPLTSQQRRLLVKATTATPTMGKSYIELDILDTLGNLDIIVRPYHTPVAYTAQLLVSTYMTCMTNYTLFDIQTIQNTRELTPRITTTMTKLYLQWFLHNNVVSNEGYSNEVLFTLGSVDPVGPLPPAPQEEWTGGYVAAPFQGSGVKNTEAAAGYYSPKVDQWVKNASMLWGQPPAVFDEED